MKLATLRTMQCAATFTAALVLVLSPGVAVAESRHDGESPSQELSILDPTTNDQLFEAVALLEDIGVLGAQSELASLVGDSRIAEDGALELYYYANSPESKTMSLRIEEVAAKAAIPV